MKQIKLLFIALFLLVLIGAPTSAAALDTGMVTESLTDDEISNILGNLEFNKIVSYTPLTANCFDVRDDHMIVIGANSGDSAVITVYDSNGTFQYGFKTKEYGSFRVMWSEDAVAYYSIRSELLFKITMDGVITDIRRVVSSSENSVYDQNVLLSTTRRIGNSTYTMTNGSAIADALSSSYKTIIRSNSQETVVVYDATNDQIADIAVSFAFFTILSLVIARGIIVSVKKISNKTKDSSQ